MKKQIIRYFKLFKATGKKFFEDDPMGYSASIAFYTIFSLPAILIITMVIAGYFYEDQEVKQTIIDQIQRMFGSESAGQVTKIMENASQSASSIIAKIVGIGTLIFSATTVFMSLQNALNSIWKIKPKPKKEVLGYIMNRVLSFAMVMSIGFLLLVSLVIDALIVIFNNMLEEWLSGVTFYIISGINALVSLGIITLIFALIFKVLPDAKIKWRDVWVGAFVTTLLFALGKYLIGFYLGASSVGNAYGAAGSLVLLLVWVYYSCVILLFGAEFTFVYSRDIGSNIRPSNDAVFLEIKEVDNPHKKLNE
ncbi:YihY/virulence factor BrkB family protein [Fulvivirga sp. RKSG066]|uniref:YhjD/YihY/BrkB family envelope integrity protein n=1 Tax=Fulvivirga aurantia TaxID=2529383 RepID=UPI0016234810|nr:YihY/virulence factor BrkB family protein [Fulvivirga aurantia]